MLSTGRTGCALSIQYIYVDSLKKDNIYCYAEQLHELISTKPLSLFAISSDVHFEHESYKKLIFNILFLIVACFKAKIFLFIYLFLFFIYWEEISPSSGFHKTSSLVWDLGFPTSGSGRSKRRATVPTRCRCCHLNEGAFMHLIFYYLNLNSRIPNISQQYYIISFG